MDVRLTFGLGFVSPPPSPPQRTHASHPALCVLDRSSSGSPEIDFQPLKHVPLPVQTAVIAYLVRYALAWLGNLDAECAEQPAKHHFEDPSSLKKASPKP